MPDVIVGVISGYLNRFFHEVSKFGRVAGCLQVKLRNNALPYSHIWILNEFQQEKPTLPCPNIFHFSEN